MYAIVRSGGKQYKVSPGDVIRVEKLDNALGSEFNMTDVLAIGGETTITGQPVVKNASVTVVVTKQAKDRKVIIFKKKRRQGYRRFKTHRQHFTELFVKAISHDGKTAESNAPANVVDVDKARLDKIAARTTARLEAKNNKEEKSEAKPTKSVSTAGKVKKRKAPVKKAVSAKKKAGAKKSGVKKKSGAKKTTKKA